MFMNVITVYMMPMPDIPILTVVSNVNVMLGSMELANHVRTSMNVLWHGTRDSLDTNYGDILSQRNQVIPPEAPLTDYMFGKEFTLLIWSQNPKDYCHDA